MRNVLILACLFTVIGCNSFYGTNSYTYLNIVTDRTKLSGDFILFYIDSVLNKTEKTPDSIKSKFYISNEQHDLFPDDRLVHFKGNPDEWYLVAFDATPCWIAAIYAPKHMSFPLYKRDSLDEGQINRIKSRFKTEVLDKAAAYAQEHHVADSVVYEH